MNSVSLIFPHQLFEDNPCLKPDRPVFLVEEQLFFRQYRFHQQKILFHRASMKFYQSYLNDKGYDVHYIESSEAHSDIRELIPWLQKKGTGELHYTEVVDDWLEKRISEKASEYSMLCRTYPSPMFLNSLDSLQEYFKDKENFYQTDFYIHQRKQRNILVEKGNKPMGGKWSFDSENRLKYPRDKQAPGILFPEENEFSKEARAYVQSHFRNNPGNLDSPLRYPTTFEESRSWLQQFLENRFSEFGAYEDALVAEETILHHSVLSPMLNAGLISPEEVLAKALDHAAQQDIPLNSLEGFVRQILGWREFIRAVYVFKGGEERTRNFWGFKRKIPQSFWTAKTGIEPLDTVILKVLDTGYCHHIERLMVLGNFMLLCEFDPDEVYRWFMEMFIDAYDWVMVPNVYGMSQFADGGLMATKPYISGSNYLMKMGNFGKGDWQKTWDGLFWRFMHVHRAFFQKNPRLGMLVRTFDKMNQEKRERHLDIAEQFINEL